MKWITRARPKTDRIACPWLIPRFIDPEAEILYVPADEVLVAAAARGRDQLRRARCPLRPPDGKCTFEVLIDDYDLAATRRWCASLGSCTPPTSPPTSAPTRPGPGLLAIGLGGLDVEADDHRLLERAVRLRRPLRLVPTPGTERRHDRHLGYDELRAETVRQVAKLMAAAAITAPKSGGQLFLAGKPTSWRRSSSTIPAPGPSWQLGCEPEVRSAGSPSGSETPRSPKRSTPSCSSDCCRGGTRRTTTAAPAATPPAPSSFTPPRTCVTTRPSSSSPVRPATCETSTWASP